MTDATTFCDFCGAANDPLGTVCAACGQPLAGASGSLTGLLPPDSVLKQRYRLRRQVGTGGFGAVYAAEDLPLGNRRVAIKEMRQSGLTKAERQEATDAFQREAHLLAQLHHPNLPAIYDYFSEASRWYLVMEFITGETLEARLTHTPGRQLPVQEVLTIGVQLCNVLAYLHTNQPPVIFRDLKPSNVMVTPQGAVYLIDFGIARVFKPGQAKDTMAFGSIGYAAPEQYGKMQTTAQSDIYSLGATLYQLLSGTDPAQTPFHFAPLALASPTGLERLVLQMVEQEPGRRPASTRLIEQHLKDMAEGHSSRQADTPRSAIEPPPPSREAPYDTYAVQYSRPLDEPVPYQQYTPSSPAVEAPLYWAVPPPPLVIHQPVIVTPAKPKTGGFAIASLILGCAGAFLAMVQLFLEAGAALDTTESFSTDAALLLIFLLILWIPAIIAVVLGHLARRQIQRSEGQRGGAGLSIAGLVLGYLSLGLPLVGLVLFTLARV